MECLEEIIAEAKCCAADMGHKHIMSARFGNDNKEAEFNMLRMNAYIRTLENNIPKFETKKEIVSILPKKVSFDSLKKKNNFLYLNPIPEEKVICTEVEITPCLTDSDIQAIIEEIRLLCVTCNCNCK